jgi:putative membrane protein
VKRRTVLALGAATIVAAQAAPLDGRFSTHMLQHLLIGDLGPLLIALGLDRSRLRVPALVALPLWAAALVCWHVTPLYDAALRHEPVHLLQHVTFLVAGLAVWLVLLCGPAAPWKLAYVLAMWLVSMGLSQFFLWSGRAYYAGYSVDDQRVGGGVMLLEGSVVMLGVIVWLLLELFRDPEPQAT